MGVLGQMPRPADVAVVADTVNELLAGESFIAQKQLVVVCDAVLRVSLLVEDDFVEADAVALRVVFRRR